jgi:hypothetical protein
VLCSRCHKCAPQRCTLSATNLTSSSTHSKDLTPFLHDLGHGLYSATFSIIIPGLPLSQFPRADHIGTCMSTTGQPSVEGSRGDDGKPFHFSKHPPLIKGILEAHSEERSRGNPRVEDAFDINEFCHANDDWEPHANTSDPANYGVPKPGIGLERTISQSPQQSFPNDEDLLCDVEKYAEASSLCYREQAHVDRFPYRPQLLDTSDTREHSSHMYTLPCYTKDTPQPVQHLISKYEPYRARFDSSESASKHRKEATRFNRSPYRPPDTDYTISEVQRDRLYHVERVYNAMTCGDAARDNKSSIAMKRWVHGAYYNSDLVEAYAHKVLDCLIQQAKRGFRGWVGVLSLIHKSLQEKLTWGNQAHNDYVTDDRKGEDEDRDVTCEERLESILRALQEEKTICEDVMNSACQIRMFVNAPKAYANRKYQNRVGNSKRGRTKDSDTLDTPCKVRKLNPKPVTRARRTGSNKIAETAPHIRLESQPREMSPFQRSQVGLSTSSAFVRSPKLYKTHRPASLQDIPSIQSRIHAMSPLQKSSKGSPYSLRISTVPPHQQQHTLGMSPPALSHGITSEPASPGDTHVMQNPDNDPWPAIRQRGDVYYPHDEPLFDRCWSSPTGNGQQGQACTGVSANLFAQHPQLAEKAVNPIQQIHGAYNDQNFSQYWEAQQPVHQFPYLGPSDTCDQL